MLKFTDVDNVDHYVSLVNFDDIAISGANNRNVVKIYRYVADQLVRSEFVVDDEACEIIKNQLNNIKD